VRFVIYSLAIFITFIVEIRSLFEFCFIITSGIVIVSVLKCRLHFGYEAGGILRILICVILGLECARCKQYVEHLSKMSPKVKGLGRNRYRNKEYRFTSTVTRRLVSSVASLLA